ncbi:uncharacterized protein LOC135697545 [Ochlerotatus camptorhynchus]|uniref:uncharacterized protein LOC135697545 n=1 Tax=Ochlerotatus camptorhynchus TaxID=644619 RepID=UPI0031E29FDE
MGGARSQIHHRVILKCFSDYTDFQSDMDCLVTARVTGKIPSVPVDISEWKFSSAQLKLSDKLPVLYETQFGWVISGALKESEEEVINVLCATNEDLLLKSIQRFFEQEELPEERVLTNEEQAIEDHFYKTYRRDEDGLFVVQIPFRESINELGNSLSLALKRFLSIEKHLTIKPEMKEMYQEFMQEYKDLGHCHEILPQADINVPRRKQPSQPSLKIGLFNGKTINHHLDIASYGINIHPYTPYNEAAELQIRSIQTGRCPLC